MKLFTAIAWILLFANALHAAPADTLVAEGRTYLAAHDVTNANARFAAALGLAPNHEAANVLYAATRLLTIVNRPEGKALLDKFGVAETNRSIYRWSATIATDTNRVPIAPTNTSAAELTAFARTTLLNELIGAGANLATVSNPSFTLLLTANETATVKVTIDYGDLLLMRAGLKFAEYGIYTVNSWNVDAQLTAIRALMDVEDPVSEQVLKQFPQLATFATTNDLIAARQAFSDAVALYNTASAIIRARPLDVTRLFNAAPEAFDSELMFRTTLNEFKQSLNGPVVLTVDPNLSLNFGQHFSGVAAPRAFMPDVKSNAFVAGTLPDPTFGGALQGLSRHDVEMLLGAEKHLGLPFAPSFTPPQRLPDGSFRMDLMAIDGTPLAVQSSLDLQAWETLNIVTVSNGTVTLHDGAVDAGVNRYYRALDLSRSVPPDFVPPNDYFTNRAVVAGSSFSVIGFNGGATMEEDEPDHTGANDGRTVWWSWTAPFSGRFRADTLGTPFYCTLAIYEGDSIGALSLVTTDAGTGPEGSSYVIFDAEASVNYAIVIATEPWYPADKVVLNLRPVPLNDAFEDAIEIVGMTNTVSGSSVNASKQFLSTFGVYEPNHADNRGGSSVWWQWTSSTESLVTIDTRGSSFDTLLAVYTDTGVLAELVSNDDAAGGSELSSSVTFVASGGVTYFIAIDGYDGGSGAIVLNLRAANLPPPPNNDFANRIAISGQLATVNGVNFGADREPGEPDHFYTDGARSVWWTWTAPVDGFVTIDTEGTTIDPALAVYMGNSISSLIPIVNSPAFGDNVAVCEFSTIAGATYQIAVDGFAFEAGEIVLTLNQVAGPRIAPAFSQQPSSTAVLAGENVTFDPSVTGSFPMQFQWQKNGTNVPGATNRVLAITSVQTNNAGSYTLRVTNAVSFAVSSPAVLTVAVPPPNDAFANATTIVGRTNTFTANNVLATGEPGEPEHAFYPGGKSLWWNWTAPVSGLVTIDTAGSNFDTMLAVYTGTAVSALSHIISDDESGPGSTSSLTFSAAAGITYRIAVDGYYGDAGTIILNLRQP